MAFFQSEHAAELAATASYLSTPGKGILAADESTGTIGKRLASIAVENTEDNRRALRELLFTAPDFEKHISGVIMFDETLGQSCADGTPFVSLLRAKGVVPGVKVDKGVVSLPGNARGETTTQGLDDLDARCTAYYARGARFAKWRAVLTIGDGLPLRAVPRRQREMPRATPPSASARSRPDRRTRDTHGRRPRHPRVRRRHGTRPRARLRRPPRTPRHDGGHDPQTQHGHRRKISAGASPRRRRREPRSPRWDASFPARSRHPLLIRRTERGGRDETPRGDESTRGGSTVDALVFIRSGPAGVVSQGVGEAIPPTSPSLRRRSSDARRRTGRRPSGRRRERENEGKVLGGDEATSRTRARCRERPGTLRKGILIIRRVNIIARERNVRERTRAREMRHSPRERRAIRRGVDPPRLVSSRLVNGLVSIFFVLETLRRKKNKTRFVRRSRSARARVSAWRESSPRRTRRPATPLRHRFVHHRFVRDGHRSRLRPPLRPPLPVHPSSVLSSTSRLFSSMGPCAVHRSTTRAMATRAATTDGLIRGRARVRPRVMRRASDRHRRRPLV